MNDRFVVSKGGTSVSTDQVLVTSGHSVNQPNGSYLTFCPTQTLVDNNSNEMISQQNSHPSHQHIQRHDNNHSLPPMSSFVANVTTNVSQTVTANVNCERTVSTTHPMLNSQDLNIELLTAQTANDLEAYNNDPLDQTFVDALNMSQFVFDPFLTDGQSIAAQVNSNTEETVYYSSDMSDLAATQVSTQTSTNTTNAQAFGLTIGPHISDIFSVLDSLETDALADNLLNGDQYCTTESLVASNNLTNNSFMSQTHHHQQQHHHQHHHQTQAQQQHPQQMQPTLQIAANLSSNQLTPRSQAVHLTPIVLPAISTQHMMTMTNTTQSLIHSNDTTNGNPVVNNALPVNMKHIDAQSIDKSNAKSININDNKVSIHLTRFEDKELIEETKCFKCLICNFISLEKSVVSKHLIENHKRETKVTSDEDNSKMMVSKKANTYMCSKCFKGFPTLLACRQHMVSLHKLKVDNVTLETIESDQNISPIKDKIVTKILQKEVLSETNDNLQNKKASKLRHILPNGKVEVQQEQLISSGKKTKQVIVTKIHESNNNNIESINNNMTDNNNQNNNTTNILNGNSVQHNNHVNVKRLAWKKKVKREQGTYICEFKGCSVRFRAIDNLQKHHRCHSDTGSGFVCSNCNKSCEQWSSMAGHLWRCHGIDLELHACEHCSYRTYSLSILENIHKRIHSNEKNFLCDTCGKGFKNCKQLINHKVKHVVKTSVVKTHECHICLRQFNDARQKKVHLNNVHHKTRPYICNHCNHSAASRSALRTHMRQHTGEKPFKCDKCSYSTSDHNSLRRHKMRHSGERPYKCPFCSYACIQSSTYKQHLKNKHPGLSEGIMFNCQFCDFKTVNQDMYGTHMSEHMRNGYNGHKDAIKDNNKLETDSDTLSMAPDSPTLRFACIVGQTISSQTNTPSVSYAS
ncbi:histone-lysine N-methyltransferase PRDM9-like [Oppia nitens]|uniref:histone-lysine N-methyltransferase PRDM9-like n=1 Tax=Oppia nitens TaxID=1686743 RepID=UPI0023DC02D1|nr:histone-lysine N-methyltransferase PRDM9-like [Oppia nitens]